MQHPSLLKYIFIIAVLSSCVKKELNEHANGPEHRNQYSDSLVKAENAYIIELNIRFAEEQYNSLLDEYFELKTNSSGDTIYRPIMLEIASARPMVQHTPDSTSNTITEVEYTMEVPKWSVVPINFLKIASVEMLDGEMQIEYESSDPPEGFSDLVEFFDKQVRPVHLK